MNLESQQPVSAPEGAQLFRPMEIYRQLDRRDPAHRY